MSLFGKCEETEALLEHVKDHVDALERDKIKKMSEEIESMAKTVTEHVKLVDRALRNQEEMAAKQENLITRSFKELHEQKVSYADIIKGSCAKVVKGVSVKFADMKKQQEQVTTPTREIFSAIGTAMDKERRKLNVVVHNLEESQPSETESREKQDLLKFQAFIKDALNLNLRAVKSFRAGKTQEERPKLLVVILEDIATKIELLRMSSQLRSIPEWRHVFINPDLTPAEREANRKLCQELASRRAEGEANLMIRQGKIVSVGRNLCSLR